MGEKEAIDAGKAGVRGRGGQPTLKQRPQGTKTIGDERVIWYSIEGCLIECPCLACPGTVHPQWGGGRPEADPMMDVLTLSMTTNDQPMRRIRGSMGSAPDAST
jgi:hypothetical protein